MGNKIPIGVFYQNEHVPTYQEITARIPDYMENPPALAIADNEGKTITSIDKLLADLLVAKPT